MLMDRMGLVLPLEHGSEELKATATTEEQFQFDQELAQALGCLTLHSKPDLLSQHHIAIYPETGGLTLWWEGLVGIDQAKSTEDTLVSQMKAPGIARIDGLTYAGLYRRASKLPGLARFRHQDADPGELQPGDKVAMQYDPTRAPYKSHIIDKID